MQVTSTGDSRGPRPVLAEGPPLATSGSDTVFSAHAPHRQMPPPPYTLSLWFFETEFLFIIAQAILEFSL